MENLSIVDLKKLAKKRKIKQYYIMKRKELLELLALETLPFKYKQEKMTIKELRDLAKERGLRGFWSLSREQLMNVLYPPLPPNNEELKQRPADKKNENHREAAEHEQPKNENAYNVGINVLEDAIENGA